MIKAEDLVNICRNYILLESSGIGIDKKTKYFFQKKGEEYFQNIADKMKNAEYKFVPYKEKLVLKGKNKYPRVISIPGYQDKIVLKYLSKRLIKDYYEGESLELAQKKIGEILEKRKKYKYFIKLDLTNFYDNINHHILFNILKTKEEISETINFPIFPLVKKAIETPVVEENSSDFEKNKKNIRGVHQGLAISNILAEIYLEKFDEELKKEKGLECFRYVDDILIFFNNEEVKSHYMEKAKEILEKIELKLLNEYHLELNKSKTDFGKIENGIEYLGYKICSNKITVKRSNVLKFEKKMEKLFSEYKYISQHNEKLKKFQIWRINNFITGIKVKSTEDEKKVKKYGWLFYFSKIDDLLLVYHLDYLLKKFSKKYGLEHSKLKRFSRSLNEIKFNKESIYILDVDKEYPSIDEKMKFLIEMNLYENVELKNKSDENIEKLFNGILFKTIKELEEDKGKES
ncbi:reverse transcriptase [Propionigenium maris DSM 9537]|uniref:Reverse transcriptase n=1 Tax=Propionigenium maris DSM 9537 TaxID=1123000 RepID=A0A9W6LMA3_9FUSO|nr:reverse transcriptase/maturase family protein [Propionigenium maris]GLI56131.1 reverse transcriptase [Propionigenium maris DSM 9537]